LGLQLFLQASQLAKRWFWEKHLGEPSELKKKKKTKQNGKNTCCRQAASSKHIVRRV